jgi:hypothetical protein
MAQSISLSVDEVRCGLPGTLVIVGRSEIGEPTYIAISVADVSKVAPALLEGATIGLRYQWPEAGTPVAGGYIGVLESIPRAAKDTMEPLLRVHTDGGTLLLLFPPEAAIASGRELQALGIAASAPEPSKRN